MEVNWVRDIKEKIEKLIQGEYFAGIAPLKDATFSILGLNNGIAPRQQVTLRVQPADAEAFDVPAIVRIDTPIEKEYYLAGGILQYVLTQILK